MQICVAVLFSDKYDHSDPVRSPFDTFSKSKEIGMRKQKLFALIVSFAAIIGTAAIVQPYVTAESCCGSSEFATCTGSKTCTACKNCRSCKHCKDGGTCGVCSKKVE